MKSGLDIFMTRAGITNAELSRLTGVSRQHIGRIRKGERELRREFALVIAPILKCTAEELMFPHKARLDEQRFLKLYRLADSDQGQDNPLLAFETNLLAQLLPGVESHNLRLATVDTDHYAGKVSKGDIVVLDTSIRSPSRTGLYAVEIAAAIQWRYLTPTTTGKVSVQSEDQHSPAEMVDPDQIKLVGRARLRISTI